MQMQDARSANIKQFGAVLCLLICLFVAIAPVVWSISGSGMMAIFGIGGLGVLVLSYSAGADGLRAISRQERIERDLREHVSSLEQRLHALCGILEAKGFDLAEVYALLEHHVITTPFLDEDDVVLPAILVTGGEGK